MLGRAASLSRALRNQHALAPRLRWTSVHASDVEGVTTTPGAVQRSFHGGKTLESVDQYAQSPDAGVLSKCERRWVQITVISHCCSPEGAEVYSLPYRSGCRELIDRMLRVDHAGESGAVRRRRRFPV